MIHAIGEMLKYLKAFKKCEIFLHVLRYLLPTETFNLNSRLLDHDGLSCVSLSTEKGHLDDTLLNFKVPLIDFMHLESATSMLGRGGYAVVWKGIKFSNF